MAHRFGSVAPGANAPPSIDPDDSGDEEWSGPNPAPKKNKFDLDAVPGKTSHPASALSSVRSEHPSFASNQPDSVLNMPAPSDGNGAKIGSKFAQQVVNHYNLGAGHGRAGRRTRNNSRIIRLRSFNNWIKALLLNEGLKIVKSRFDNLKKVNILDMACGKGGDIGKYDQLAQEFNIDHVTFVDISNESIADARKRYDALRRSWTADFYVVDCAQDEFGNHPVLRNRRFHLVVCHFAVHYSFETFDRANVMLSNLCKPLFPAGVLILTTMNAFEIVQRLRDVADRKGAGKSAAEGIVKQEKGEAASYSDPVSLSNPVFRLEPKFNLNDIPLFRATYDFHLDDVVNLPEFLVHPPLLNSIARKHFMLMDNNLSKSFPDLFERFGSLHNESYRNLLVRMGGLRRCMKRHFDEALGPHSMGNGSGGASQGAGDDADGSSSAFGGVDADNDLVDPKTFLEQFRSAYTYFTQGPPREIVAENEDVDDGKRAPKPPPKEEVGKDESVGTLSKDEWEIVSLYRSYVFNKHPESVKYEQKEQSAESTELEPLNDRQKFLQRLGVAYVNHRLGPLFHNEDEKAKVEAN